MIIILMFDFRKDFPPRMDPTEKEVKKDSKTMSRPKKLEEKKEVFDPKEHEVNVLLLFNLYFNNLFSGVFKIHPPLC